MNQFDRELKLTVFLCLGDIILALKTKTLAYITDIIALFDLGFAAAYELSQSKDQDAVDYSERLKENLIESYMCAIHGLSVEDNRGQTLITDLNLIRHIPNVV